MKEHTVVVSEGKYIPLKERKAMHKLWHDTFDAQESYKPISSKDLLTHIFFMVKHNSKLLSVGTLEPVFVKFRSKRYKLWGIGGIVSIIRREGYGTTMMAAMRKYVKIKRLTAIGFCAKKNSGFYIKCGFKIAKNEAWRFTYKKKDGTLEKNPCGDDVIYIDGRNKLMKDFLAHKKEIVWINPPHW